MNSDSLIWLGFILLIFSPLILQVIKKTIFYNKEFEANKKALKIGVVKCNQCGYKGLPKPSYHLDRFVCFECGSYSWKK